MIVVIFGWPLTCQTNLSAHELTSVIVAVDHAHDLHLAERTDLNTSCGDDFEHVLHHLARGSSPLATQPRRYGAHCQVVQFSGVDFLGDHDAAEPLGV